MEIKSVIDIINNRIAEGDNALMVSALLFAISVLEKQIEKKPQEVTEEIDHFVENSPAHRRILFCPKCGTRLRIESWTSKRCFGAGTVLCDNRKPKYCPDCGQRIDWTESFE